ncbi:MAG TPA: peptide-methionine (S)-S-oxide reductase MsrA [Bacteroidales bacterium]|nr:peptide-methionine (S)-S-oxide reductase MsrA [Bacteroidales bacterium]
MKYCLIIVLFMASIHGNAQVSHDKIVLGGGCFWCLEAVFETLNGVEEVVSGYAGGITANPTYREVCDGNTGHAEVVMIHYDKNSISFEEILQVFFTVHDPTILNRQGMDVGTQYRSVIFYTTHEQAEAANDIVKELNKLRVFKNPIVTQIDKLSEFYRAEDYHQDYFAKNPNNAYCQFTIQPKLDKMKKYFREKLK